MQKVDANITENEAIFIDTPPEINLGTKNSNCKQDNRFLFRKGFIGVLSKPGQL